MTMGEPVFEVQRLRQRLYDPERKQEFVVTVPMRLAFPAGGFVTILGPNACGKTTLLTVFGLLRRPSSLDSVERYYIHVPNGDKTETLDMVKEWHSGKRIEQIRRRYLGFALQSGELLPALTVRENIAIPLRVNGASAKECRKRVDELLDRFGLMKGSNSNKLPDSRVNTISGGEYQRVALARAIAHRPVLVFVDEPTASLNRKTAREALTQLRELQRESGGRTAIVMITHDETLAMEFADLVVRMEAVSATEGRVASITPNVPVVSSEVESERR